MVNNIVFTGNGKQYMTSGGSPDALVQGHFLWSGVAIVSRPWPA